MRRNKCKDGHVGPGSKEYQENYKKIKWDNEVEIKEFVDKPKEESDLAEWFYPTANSLSESYGRKWEGRVPILVEKAWEHQQKRIDKLVTDLFRYKYELELSVKLIDELEQEKDDLMKRIEDLEDKIKDMEYEHREELARMEQE